MGYQPIQTKKIYEVVEDALVDKIKAGELKSGDKLDSVEQLAKKFDVSRSAVREALSGMRAMGLLVMRQGEGTFVTRFDASNFSLPATTGLLMKKDDIKELYEVRKILEVGAASSAAMNYETSDLIPIKIAIDEMIDAKKNGYIGEKADINFHIAIVNATHNQMLINLMRSVTEMMDYTIKETRELLINSENKVDSLIEEHLLIFNAIKERQPDLAGKHMLNHLMKVEQSLEKYM